MKFEELSTTRANLWEKMNETFGQTQCNRAPSFLIFFLHLLDKDAHENMGGDFQVTEYFKRY